MGCPRRFLVVFFGFWGLLVSIGYRAVVAMVFTHVIKSTKESDQSHYNCSALDDNRDLSLNWSVATSQYLDTFYFVGSVITQVPGGYLAARFSPRRVCGISILTSSVLMVCLPVSITFNLYLVFSIRFLQGIVEGCSVPALNGVISAWAPKSERSRMITLVYAGAYLSPAAAQVVSGFTACWLAWYASLYIYGGVGILWSVLWLCCLYDTPNQHPSLGRKESDLFEREGPAVKHGSAGVASHIPWCRILRSLPMSAIMAGSFCRNWIFAIMIMEIPRYFKDAYKLNIASIGLMSALPEVLMTIVTVAGGIVVDKLIKSRMVSTTVGRKLAECIGFGIEAFCILGLRWVNDRHLALILLCVGVAFSGLAISGYQVNPLDLAPQYASVLTGLSRLGAVGAIMSTVVAGKLREENVTSWQEIFTIAGAIHLGGVVYYGIFASGNRQDWADAGEFKPLTSSARGASTSSLQSEPLAQEDADIMYSRSQQYDRISDCDIDDWYTTSYP